MKNNILFLSILLFKVMLHAQPTIEWQKAFGGSYTEQSESIKQTSEGGFITAGRAISTNGEVMGNHGGVDFWILKLDTIGAIHWKKTYGGSDSETPYEIQQTLDGGYVVAGYTLSSEGDVSGHHGYFDAWVLKIDAEGNIQWQNSLGGSGWEEANDIQQTIDGGYIIVGRSSAIGDDVTVNHGSFDYWVVKLNSSGNLEWQKSYGGSKEDIGYAIRQTADGGFIVAGESASNDGDVTSNHGSLDYWVLKLNYEGKIEWQKSLGGSSIDRANDILIAKNGGYVVFGQVYSNNGDVVGHHGYNDFWVVKLSEMGELEWQNALGGSNEDYATEIHQTSDGGYVMTGQTQSNNGDVYGNDGGADLWVVKIAESGEIQWQKALGGSLAEWGNSIYETRDNGYIVSGYTSSNNGDVSGNHGGDDIWVVKLSPESSSTTELQSPFLEIFPNPAEQSISIKIPNSAMGSTETDPVIAYSVSDLLGRELIRQAISKGKIGAVEIDIAKLPRGMYLVTAGMASGKVFTGKFSKQ